MTGMASAAAQTIKGHSRDYGQVIYQLPHLMDLSYVELEKRNLEMKRRRLSGVTSDEVRDEMLDYLKNEGGLRQ